MTREQLEHILRAASRISDAKSVIVIGSQSVLASHTESQLPPEATTSMEADVAFFNDPDDDKADLVDGAIGELSGFHETFGYYAQGVSIAIAVLPEGWQERIIVLDTPGTAPARGLCLDPHDCVISKLVAARPKDIAFAEALLRTGVIDLDVLAPRVETLNAHPLVTQRTRNWIAGQRRKHS